MTTYEIILTVVLVIWLIHYIVFGLRAKRVVSRNARAVIAAHPAPGTPVDPDWPPQDLQFP